MPTTPPVPTELIEQARQRMQAQGPAPRSKASLQAEYADNYVAHEAATAEGDTAAAKVLKANLDVLTAAINAAT